MKISIEEVESALQASKVEPAQQEAVLAHLNTVLKELEEEKLNNQAPKLKNEFGIILFDPDNKLAGQEFVAAAYTIAQGENHELVLDKISEAAKTQNELAKKKNHLITSIGEALESLKRKFIKEKGVNLKTKGVVRVIISNNKLI